MIQQNKISQVINTADIVDVISESVILKKSGNNFFGLCPFHSEKTGSFSVSPSKQIFHCFGCGEGGNVLSFVMKYHGINFVEAVKKLAQNYNITIETNDPVKKAQMDLKEKLFDLNKIIMNHYSDVFKASISAKKAREYLEKRKINKETIQKFNLGFAPDSWEFAVQILRKSKTLSNLGVKSGLVLEKKQKTGHYDRFRNRIMFPIFDINMQVAGFGGRVMDESMPKYMNSPQTPVYNKSRILYGLHAARQFCRQLGFVYIVEGYFDFLSLYQNGVKNTIASLGTALTSDHIRILKGYASKMILVFDSDAAGINAAKKSIDIFMKEGVDTRILILPKGHDPDSYIVKFKKEGFSKLALNAKTILKFLLHVTIEEHGLSIYGKTKIIDDMSAHLILIENGVLRSLYIREISETLSIDERMVLNKVKEKYLSHTKKSGFDLSQASDEYELESDPREKQIISLMLNYPQSIDEIIKKDVINYFYSEKLKKIAKKIIKTPLSSDIKIFVCNVLENIKDKDEKQIVTLLAMEDFAIEGEDIKKTASAIINRMIWVVKKQNNIIKSKIINAQKKSDFNNMSDDINELLKQKQAENNQLYNI